MTPPTPGYLMNNQFSRSDNRGSHSRPLWCARSLAGGPDPEALPRKRPSGQ